MVFDFKFDVFLEAFLCTYTCKQPLETNLDIRGSKFGFLGEKGLEPEKNCAELMTVRLSERAQLQHLLFCVPDIWGPIRAF